MRSIIGVLLLTTAAGAQPLPQPKVGACPAGYRDSGDYCAPTHDRVRPAIVKTGQCPSGWMQSGAYCISTK